MKLRRILTTALLLLALMGSTLHFIAAGDGHLKGGIQVHPTGR